MLAYSTAINSRLEGLLAEYSESHQNKFNVLIHWIFEPLAIWAILALFWSLPIPLAISKFSWMNGMTLLVLCLLTYFAWLSKPIAIVLAFFAIIFYCLVIQFASIVTVPIWPFALPLFIVSWGALYLGHRVEGNFPSVFKNPHMLFIGPVWLLTKTQLVRSREEYHGLSE
jgi:uncharacterized membrane protein YGL010W